MAVVDGGYYILMGQKIYYFDKASKIKVPLCTNVDCKHNSEDCDAYINMILYLWYFEESLYYVIEEFNYELSTSDYVLYKCDMDGSNKERIKIIATCDGVVPEMTLHRGNIYYSIYDSEDSCSLNVTNISSKGESKKIYIHNGLYADMHGIKGYGDGVFFEADITKNVNSEDDYEFEYTIMYYDSICESVYTIINDAGSDYIVANGDVYDVRTDGVHKLDLTNGKDSIFFNPEAMVILSYDDENFYFDNLFDIDLGNTPENERKIWVVNDDGKLIDTIQIDSQYLCDFGDSDYLFQDFSDGMKVLDKTQIGTGEHEWVKLGE